MTAKSVDNRKLRFQEGEQILCYHGPLIYEAKCIKSRIINDGAEYLIHYNGWNKNWDEWVAQDRLLEHNEENIVKKHELDGNQKALKKGSKRRTSVGSGGEKDDSNSRSNSPKPPIFGRKSVSTPTTQITQIKFEKQPDVISARKNRSIVLTPEPKSSLPFKLPNSTSRKRPRGSSNSQESATVPNPDDCQLYGALLEVEYTDFIIITVHLPEELQNLLLYDLELVCKRKKVTKLPARVTVNEITENYILHKTSVSDESSKFKETAIAMKDYFDAVLSTKLLYSFEKPQYQKIMEGKSDAPSSVYSVIHFIRMFAKIGQLLAHLELDEYSTNLIEENINDYVRYLNLNINKFISIDDYQNTNADYQRRVRS